MPTSTSRPAVRRDANKVIMTLAARQHAVVARWQLLDAGVSPDLVDHRVRAGSLRLLHRGVYLVGPVTTPRTRDMAAVLACGDGAVLSHRSAVVVWGVPARGRGDELVEVIVSRGRAGRRPGIRVRHVHTLRADDVTVRDSIAITTPARTIYDLASTVTNRELEQVLAEAFALRIVERVQLLETIALNAGRPGASRLLRLLNEDTHLALTRSEAEERFLALVRKAGLHDPDVNVEVSGFEVDFLWRAERLVVEVDGKAFHSAGPRFENDRRRDAILLAAGLRVMRITWKQIVKEPEALLIRLGQALVVHQRHALTIEANAGAPAG